MPDPYPLVTGSYASPRALLVISEALLVSLNGWLEDQAAHLMPSGQWSNILDNFA